MIIKNSKDQIKSYLEDTSNINGSADILYVPDDIDDIKQILKVCRDGNISLTCSAAHTGTTGGCVPLEGAILSLERLNKIVSIEKNEKTVVLEPGVSLKDLEAELNRFELTFRPQPTESLATIGGAVSTCASGTRGFRYGSIRKYVLAMDVILSDGSLLKIKRGESFANKREFNCVVSGKSLNFLIPTYKIPNTKSQAGFFVEDDMDLIDLFIGSEGTLGIIAGIKIKVQEMSRGSFDGVVFFLNQDTALMFVNKIKEFKREGIFNPTSLEFIDSNSLDFLREDYPQLIKKSTAVYFEQEFLEDDEDSLMKVWIELIESFNIDLENVWFGDNELSRNKIYEFRHKLPEKINEFLRHNNQVKVATDISVPEDSFAEMFNFYIQKSSESKISHVNFGHIGENHLHFNFLPKSNHEYREAKEILLEFVKKAVDLGGTVSAEHGIGKIKKEYLEIMYGHEKIKEMAKLKKYFDPLFILGRNNIFDYNLISEVGEL